MSERSRDRAPARARANEIRIVVYRHAFTRKDAAKNEYRHERTFRDAEDGGDLRMQMRDAEHICAGAVDARVHPVLTWLLRAFEQLPIEIDCDDILRAQSNAARPARVDEYAISARHAVTQTPVEIHQPFGGQQANWSGKVGFYCFQI